MIREDIAKIGTQIEALTDYVNRVPTGDEFPQLLERTFEFATLKAEHERIKKVLRGI